MKRLLYPIFAILVVAACSKDTINSTPGDTEFSAQMSESNNGIYKGIFTTDNADFRGTIQITLPVENANTLTLVTPRAMLSLSNGTVEVANAKKDAILDNGNRQITFGNSDLTFIVTVDANGKTPQISDVSYQQLSANILVAKHTERAPITPITGTYECGTCNNHPVLGTGTTQTFNVMLIDDGMGSVTVSTQTSLGGSTFNGIGFQDAGSCADVGTTTTCDINSGVSGGSADGFIVNGNPVTWIGTHVFNNEPTVNGNDASTFAGTWSWDSNGYGTITGTFTGEGEGDQILVFEDFEDATVDYTLTFEDTAMGFNDYFRITDGTDVNAGINFVKDLQSFGVMDSDGVIGNGVAPASLTWSNLDITGLTTINFSAFFAEDDDTFGQQHWDASDYVNVEYSFDGINYTTFFAIRNNGAAMNSAPFVDTDLNGVGDGTEITDSMVEFMASFVNNGTTNPTNSTTVSIRIDTSLNDSGEDIAIDNVSIIGN